MVWQLLSVVCLTSFAACADGDKVPAGSSDGGQPDSVSSPSQGGHSAIQTVTSAGEGGNPAGGSGGQDVTVAGGGAQSDGGSGGGAGEGPEPPLDSATVAVLDMDQRMYARCEDYKKGTDYPQDADGMPLKLYHGNLEQHPVLTAQAALSWLACLRETKDEWYREHALFAGHYLINMSDDFDGAMFFPYHFDFNMHGNKRNKMIAPWYSGMTQGQVLSVFSRLGELTGDKEWEVAAAAVLKSFSHLRGKAEPWILMVDEDNSLWIEEYPSDGESHVLNGFMFGMFGLYDYYAWQGDAFAHKTFLQNLHTLRLNVERFRNTGELSAYCIAHRVQAANYHAIHIEELNAMTRITNDDYFASVADLFAADSSP